MVDDSRDAETKRAPALRAASPRRPNVLVVVPATQTPSSELGYAAELARALRAELHVLRLVSPVAPRRQLQEGPIDYAEALRQLESKVAVCRETRGWCQRVLKQPLPTRRLRLRAGDPARVTALRAAELNAAIVVLTCGNCREASEAIARTLARTSPRAVLVAPERASAMV